MIRERIEPTVLARNIEAAIAIQQTHMPLLGDKRSKSQIAVALFPSLNVDKWSSNSHIAANPASLRRR